MAKTKYIGVDVDKIQSFIDYLRLRYSQLNGVICWEKPKDLVHLGSCEVCEVMHAFYQLGSERFEKIHWSDNFNESAYRKLLGEVIQVILRFHDPELKRAAKANALYWSKDIAEVVWRCDAYAQAGGDVGVDHLLAGAWLNDGAKRMKGTYDWIVREPLPIPRPEAIVIPKV
jgi:hypothetical protein